MIAMGQSPRATCHVQHPSRPTANARRCMPAFGCRTTSAKHHPGRRVDITLPHKESSTVPFSQGQGGAHDLTHEGLWLQRRMRRDLPLRRRRRIRSNQIPEESLWRRPPEASRSPSPEVVPHSAIQPGAQHDPWLPLRTGHHRNTIKLVMGVLRPIPPAHCHDLPSNIAAQL